MTLAASTTSTSARKNTGKSDFVSTEVGSIPSDWTVKTLQELCKLINGRGFKPYEWRSSGLPIIRIQNLNGSSEFNYYDGAYDRKLEVPTGQLLFAWSGSRGTSFGPHVWNGPLGLLNYHTWKVQTDTSTVTQLFLLHKLRQLTAEIEGWAHGASALVHVQKWQMEGFKLAIPTSVTEQQAIAEALSDADALIEGLESLIAKKRAIKQGAMQELLSGKRRLPRFEGDWEKTTLGSLGQFLKGSGVRKDEAQSGDLPCIRYGEIYTTHHDHVRHFTSRISRQVARTALAIRKGDILFAGSGETKEEIGKCVAYLGDHEAYAGGDTVVLRPHSSDSAFLGYYLNSPAIVKQKASQGQGDAVVHISSRALSSIAISIPKPDEQSAIAAVLADMDAEIEALDAKCAKARAIKHGMMQELLTGRVRLV